MVVTIRKHKHKLASIESSNKRQYLSLKYSDQENVIVRPFPPVGTHVSGYLRWKCRSKQLFFFYIFIYIYLSLRLTNGFLDPSVESISANDRLHMKHRSTLRVFHNLSQ